MLPFSLPEYCPELHVEGRPLMLLKLPSPDQQTLVSSLFQKRNHQGWCYRFFSSGDDTCLALLGREHAGTDQFLRSVVYALQEVCGEENPLPEILETRLVPTSFDLFADNDERGVQQREEGKGQDFLTKYDLRLTARASFGSGLHPSTRLAVCLLEETARLRDGFAKRVLDVGCGTGILSLICARKGAWAVHAVDRDPEAIEAARLNAAANRLEEVIEVEQTPIAMLSPAYDLVVANLAVSVLHGLLPELCRLVSGNGFLVLSGFQKGQGNRLLQKVRERKLQLVKDRAETGWLAFLCSKDRAVF